MGTAVSPDRFRDQPIYWFAILDGAVERGDHATAARAQAQLRRLGVRVRYGRPRPNRQEGIADAR
jgi:hypothetical protein